MESIVGISNDEEHEMEDESVRVRVLGRGEEGGRQRVSRGLAFLSCGALTDATRRTLLGKSFL
jgi:hypothetical protein